MLCWRVFTSCVPRHRFSRTSSNNRRPTRHIVERAQMINSVASQKSSCRFVSERFSARAAWTGLLLSPSGRRH